MERTYYRDQVLETIARKVLCAYDTILFYGDPQPIPVEEIIESYGISLEYQYLRKNGRILGKTIFDDGLEAVYDQEQGMYILFPVKAGTILIDASLCENEETAGRLRFTCAHELAHWVLHKKLYQGTGESAAMTGEYPWFRCSHAHSSDKAGLLPPSGRPRYGNTGDRYGSSVPGIQTGHADQIEKPPFDLIYFIEVFTQKRTS